MSKQTPKKIQCKAKAKSTGNQCRRWAVDGFEVCQVHGAGSPKQGRPGGRPILPGGGRHSKYLPVRLAARYEESQNDPELLSMRDDIALIETRVADLLKRVDSNEAGLWWGKLRSAYDDLVAAMRRGNDQAVAAGLNDLNRFIDGGGSDFAIWGEISSLLDQRNRIVSSERKRLVEMQQMITSQEAFRLVTALLSAVNENVTDRKSRARIQAEFIRLTDRPDSSIVESGGGNGAGAKDRVT